MIEVKLDKEKANNVFNSFYELLNIQDLDKICPDYNNNDDDVKYENIIKRAIQCGLVYWNESEQCITQRLISKLDIGGGVQADALNYSKFVTLELQTMLENGQISAVLAELTGRPVALIDTLRVQDFTIASSLVKCFFGK